MFSRSASRTGGVCEPKERERDCRFATTERRRVRGLRRAGACARSRRRGRRPALRRWATLLLLSALALAAFQAPAGAARAAHERSPEEQAADVSNREAAQAQRAEQIAAQKAEAAAELQAARAQQRAAQGQGGAAAGQNAGNPAAEPARSVQNSSRVRARTAASSSPANRVSWTFTGFHPGTNTVKHVVTVRNVETNETLKLRGSTTFDGEEGKSVTPLELPPRDLQTRRLGKMEGQRPERLVRHPRPCQLQPHPRVLDRKAPEARGQRTRSRQSTLMGNVGETVEYEIVLHNTRQRAAAASNRSWTATATKARSPVAPARARSPRALRRRTCALTFSAPAIARRLALELGQDDRSAPAR